MAEANPVHDSQDAFPIGLMTHHHARLRSTLLLSSRTSGYYAWLLYKRLTILRMGRVAEEQDVGKLDKGFSARIHDRSFLRCMSLSTIGLHRLNIRARH